MARTYKRDALGRFAGGGGGGGRPKARSVSKGANRLTRDNSGRITSVGGSGATARGGRLKTASGNQRATQLDRLKGRIAGTVGKARGGARMKSAGLNKDGMAVFKSTGKPAKTYRIPQQNTQKAKVAPPSMGQKPVGKVDMKKAISRAIELRQQAKKLLSQGETLMGGGRRDGAAVNVSLGSRARQTDINRGIKGAQLVARAQRLNNKADRILDRAILSRKKAEREAAAAAKPKRTRTPLSLRTSRAKRIVKEREMKMSGTYGQWERSRQIQERALAYYAQQSRRR